MRVVHIAPGPTPTLTMSAPASINSLVPAAVTTLPATIATFGFKDTDYHLPELENPVALRLKKRIVDIQTNKAKDLFGWTVSV